MAVVVQKGKNHSQKRWLSSSSDVIISKIKPINYRSIDEIKPRIVEIFYPIVVDKLLCLVKKAFQITLRKISKA